MPRTDVKPVRVGLVDDHPMVRAGVSNVVQKIAGARLVFSADNATEALAHLEKNELDVLLLDVSLGGEDGLAVIDRLLECQPSLRIVILTVSDSEAHLVKAFTRGACGYLLKECDREQIASAIMAAANGLAVLAPTELLSSVFKGWLQSAPVNESLRPTLSERELEVLRLVASGACNRDIAKKLYLAESTIKKYSHNAMGKLGTTNRGAAAIRAMRLGLIALDDGEDAESDRETEL